MQFPKPQFPAVLDSTIMAAWKACRHKAFMQYFLHYKPVGTNVHLHAGGSYAKGLEVARKAYYDDGKSPEEAVAMGVAALCASYGDYQCPDDSGKSLERTAMALEYYFSNYPLATDEVRPHLMPTGKHAIEWSFSEPIDVNHPDTREPLLYVGRGDMLCDFAGGIFVEDDKTTSSLGARWHEQWHLRSQFTGYTWGSKKSANLDIAGVLVRGTAILKTKHECAQVISYRPQWMLDEWYEQLCDQVEDMVTAYEYFQSNIANNFYKNLDESCTSYGKCALYNVCRSKDAEAWLANEFERRVWDPVTRTERRLAPRRVKISYELTLLDDETDESVLENIKQYQPGEDVFLEHLDGDVRRDPVPAQPDGVGLPESDPLACLYLPGVSKPVGSTGEPTV